MNVSGKRFREVDQHLAQLEAVCKYGPTREERDRLRAEVTRFKTQVSGLESTLAWAKDRIKSLEGEVEARSALATSWEARTCEAEKKNQALSDELHALRETRALFTDKPDLTFEKARARFLKSKEDEIERRAAETSKALKEKFEKDVPGLVLVHLKEILRSESWPPEVEKAVQGEAWRLSEETLRAPERWPEWFKLLRDGDVKKRVCKALDEEFEKRVARGLEERFQDLQEGKWKEYVAGRASALVTNLRALFRELLGVYTFPCERCGLSAHLKVFTAEIVHLMKIGATLRVTCPSPACVDQTGGVSGFFGATKPHELPPVALEGLVASYLGRTD